MSASRLTQQPDGLEVDVDDLEGIPNRTIDRVGEYRGSSRVGNKQGERTSSQSFSEKSTHGDRR